jgi:hypothetical protein
MPAAMGKKPLETTDAIGGPAQRASMQIKVINEFACLMVELPYILRAGKIRGFSLI